MPPISLATTYAQESPGEHQGYDYSRGTNPTRYALERCLARLEGSDLNSDQDVCFGGLAFASGLASIGAVLELLKSEGPHHTVRPFLFEPFRPRPADPKKN